MSDANDDIFPTARRSSAGSDSEERPDAATAPASAPRSQAPAESAAREKVVLEFGSFREFIDDYSPFISATGMFLLDSARRPGDDVAFEVRLSDDFRLIHGRGTIEWVVPAERPGQPPGAALRFTDLDEPSRRLVARLVDNHRKAGGAPFDIDDRPQAAVAAAEHGDRLPLSADLGTETIALPVSLSGLSALDDDGETTGEAMAPETTDISASGALDGALPDPGEDPVAALKDADSVTGVPAATPPSEAPDDFDAAKTQIVALPEDLLAAARARVGPGKPAPALPELEGPPGALDALDALEDAGFEPAELPHLGEARAGEREELLPVMPPEEPAGSTPAGGGAGVDATPEKPVLEPEIPLLDALGAGSAAGATGTAPDGLTYLDVPDEDAGRAEDFSVTKTAPPIEMPDEEDLVDDYYRSSGKRPRSATTLWLGLCLLAVALGAAAWRFKDDWIGYLPATLLGGDATEVASPRPPAVSPGDVPPPGDTVRTTQATGAAAGGGIEDGVATEAEPAEAAMGQDLEGSDTGRAEPPLEPAPAGPEPAEDSSPTGSTPVAEPRAEEGADDAPSPAAATSELPRRVTGLSSRVSGEVTEVLIATDAVLSPDGFSVIRVAQPPARVVIKIHGPDEPFPREAVAVGTEHVRRLRTGVHEVDGRGEIHVVADLTGPGVVALGTEIRGSTLVVRFGRR